MNIAEKLIELRKEKGKTQYGVCKDLEISIAAIQNYENINKPRIPASKVLLKFAKYYDVSLEYLLDDELNNRKHETIEISKVFAFSDKAIENLKEIGNMEGSQLKEKTNNLLENVNMLIKVLVMIEIWEE